MPDERYISETSRLNNLLSDLDREYAVPMIGSLKEINRATRSKILDIRATLTREMKIHIKHYELTRTRLAAEKSLWFPRAYPKEAFLHLTLSQMADLIVIPTLQKSRVGLRFELNFSSTSFSIV